MDGLNHRIEDGCIVRDLIRFGWFIDIDNFDQILGLLANYGAISIAIRNDGFTWMDLDFKDSDGYYEP